MYESRWSKRYPHPGPPPAKPEETEPLTIATGDTWFLTRYRWNAYVQKLRKHEMAIALDALVRFEALGGTLTPEQMIAKNVAALVLDGSLWPAASELGQLLVRSSH